MRCYLCDHTITFKHTVQIREYLVKVCHNCFIELQPKSRKRIKSLTNGLRYDINDDVVPDSTTLPNGNKN